MKTVAVTQRTSVIGPFDEIRDTLDHRLISWLRVCGFHVAGIPNYFAVEGEKASDSLRSWVKNIRPIGFLLTGGDDLGLDKNRDELEFEILKIASENVFPVLGICRGMQIMSVWGGGTISPVKGHVGVRHDLCSPTKRSVNSYHTYKIEKMPSDFSSFEHSTEGVIEAIRHDSLPWEGWMWHPEREAPFASEDKENLSRIFNRSVEND